MTSIRQARADAAVLRAVDGWGISRNEYVDPGDTLLRLIAQSARRVQRYADMIASAVTRLDQLDSAHDGHDEFLRGMYGDQLDDPALSVLLAPLYAVTPAGDRVHIGEQISAIAKLEAEERDRLALWCHKAIAAGLEERRVKLAEAQGAHLAAVVRMFAEQLELSPVQRELVPSALRQAVDAVFGVTAIEGELV